jgi:hypothetical protein
MPKKPKIEFSDFRVPGQAQAMVIKRGKTWCTFLAHLGRCFSISSFIFQKLAMFLDRAILTDNYPKIWFFQFSAKFYPKVAGQKKGQSREGPTNNKECTNHSARHK